MASVDVPFHIQKEGKYFVIQSPVYPAYGAALTREKAYVELRDCLQLMATDWQVRWKFPELKVLVSPDGKAIRPVQMSVQGNVLRLEVNSKQSARHAPITATVR